jgi:hypothetical protein
MPSKKKDPTVKLLIIIGTLIALAGVAYLIQGKMSEGRSKSGVKWNKSGEYLKARYQKTKR